MWKVEHIKYLEKLNEKHLIERYEIADEYMFKKKLAKNIKDPYVKYILTTSLGQMDKKERDAYYLLFLKDSDFDDPINIDGKIYSRQIMNYRLIDIIYEYLLKFNANLDSDSFDFTPFFSFKNGTDIMTGFMVFIRKSDHHISEIGLFSFNINDKSFGKQVWEDFDEKIIDYLGQGYIIEWEAFKNNPACRHYDDLVRQFNGTKVDECNEYKYRLG